MKKLVELSYKYAYKRYFEMTFFRPPMYLYLSLLLVFLTQNSMIQAAAHADLAREDYRRLCREDTRTHFPPSLNDQIATYEHAYDRLLNYKDTSGLRPIISDGYRYFVGPILSSTSAIEESIFYIGDAPEQTLSDIQLLKYYGTYRNMQIILDGYDGRDDVKKYIPFLITAYFFKLLHVKNPVCEAYNPLSLVARILEKVSKMRTLPITERDMDDCFEGTRMLPEDFSYFYPVLMNNGALAPETILTHHFKHDRPRSLLVVSLMDNEKFRGHNNVFCNVGGATAYYGHDAIHAVHSGSVLKRPAIIGYGEYAGHFLNDLRRIFTPIFRALDLSKTRKKNADLLLTDLDSVRRERLVLAGIQLIFREFLVQLAPLTKREDYKPDFSDTISSKIDRLKFLRVGILDERYSLLLIHPILIQKIKMDVIFNLKTLGLSDINFVVQDFVRQIDRNEGTAPSYTVDYIYKHASGRSIFEIKTEGNKFASCKCIEGINFPKIAAALVGKTIDYESYVKRYWDGQYADIDSLSHYVKTGEFTDGEACPPPEHIVKRSIKLSGEIQRLCIDAIDHAIKYYERERDSASPPDVAITIAPNAGAISHVRRLTWIACFYENMNYLCCCCRSGRSGVSHEE